MDKKECAIAGMVRGWYSEIKNYYNYQTGLGNNQGVRHFQAVVWSNATKMGCGIKIKPGDGTYVTVLYTPAMHTFANPSEFVVENVKQREKLGQYT